MAIKDYSATAGNNTSIAGINIAEGCPAANINNAIRAEMADTRSFYEAATWTDLGHTPTRTGNTTFTINSDVTAYYTVGRRIQMFDTLTYYGTIASAVYSAPNTTVTVTMDSGTLSASLFAVALSIIDPTNDPIDISSINGYTNELSDSSFRVVGSSDATKKVALEVDGLTTETTRTLTVQDVSGTIYVTGGQDISIADGGTGAGTALAAFDNLKQASTETYTGVVELATNAETRTGTDTARAVTPANLEARHFESAQQTITAAGSLTIAHGLSKVPSMCGLILVCTTAELGYSVGDRVQTFLGAADAAFNFGATVVADATNLNVIFGSSSPTFVVHNKTTGATTQITNASWRAVFTATLN